MAASPLVFTLDESQFDSFLASFSPFKEDNDNPYCVFFGHYKSSSITLYALKKGKAKLVIAGSDQDEVATALGYAEAKKESAYPMPSWGQIGSDEVGTGDFFGPVIVTSSYVKPSQIKRLKELGVTDSKLLSDEKILFLGPILIQEFDYSSLTLDIIKYNEVHQRNNLNKIKAIMHNQVLLNLKRRHPKAMVCIDQFAPEKTYYSYLKGEQEIVTDIVFSTKGELAFPSVALASTIARYSFLRKMKQKEEELGLAIPLGAGSKVDEFALKLAKEKGIKALDDLCKKDFKNYRKLIELL